LQRNQNKHKPQIKTVPDTRHKKSPYRKTPNSIPINRRPELGQLQQADMNNVRYVEV